MARRLDHNRTRRTFAFVANFVTLVKLAVEQLSAGLATGSLGHLSTNSIFRLFTAEAVDLGNKDFARRTGSTVAGFTARMDAQSSFLLFAFEAARVRLQKHIRFRVLCFTAEAVIGWYCSFVGSLAMRTVPCVRLRFVHHFRVELFDVVLLTNPVLHALEMTCDSAFETVPYRARRGTLEQADDALAPLVGLSFTVVSIGHVAVIISVLSLGSFVLFLVRHQTIILLRPPFAVFSRLVGRQ